MRGIFLPSIVGLGLLLPLAAAAQPAAPAEPPPTGPAAPEKKGDPESGSSDETPPGAASPQEPPALDPAEQERRDQARQAFHLGSTLARMNQWTDALAAFERSLRLHDHPVTKYNIGYCERALGRYTRARKMLLAALREGSPDAENPLPASNAGKATDHLRDIDRKLARASVTMMGPDALLAVDGKPLERADEGGGRPLMVAGTREPGAPEPPPARSFDLLLDPGVHIFVVSRAGRPDVVTNAKLEPGSTTALELGAEAELPPPAGPTPLPPPEAPAPTPPKDRGPPTRAMGYTALGLGVGGLALGAGFGVASLGKKSGLDDACGPDGAQCTTSERKQLKALRSFGNVSTAGFTVGVLGVGAGTALLVGTAGDAEGDTHARASRQRTVAWTGIGVGGAGLLAGAVAGGLAVGKRNELESGCAGSLCGPEQHSEIDSYERMKTLTVTGLVGGAFAAGLGTTLLLTAGESSPSVGAWVGPRSAGLSGSF